MIIIIIIIIIAIIIICSITIFAGALAFVHQPGATNHEPKASVTQINILFIH